MAWGDFNNDGRPDLYVSRKGAPNKLFRNDGGGKFTDVTHEAGVEEPVHSFATWFFDYDNDGWLDLLVTGYYVDSTGDIAAFHLGLPNKAEVPRLYRNQGDGTFQNVTKAVGLDRVILPMGVGFGDLDNVGWPGIYFGTGAPQYETLLPNRMFRNDAGRRFQDVTSTGGFGQLQKGHAVSFADFDRDGDQDIFEMLGGAFPRRFLFLSAPCLRIPVTAGTGWACGWRARGQTARPSGRASRSPSINPAASRVWFISG